MLLPHHPSLLCRDICAAVVTVPVTVTAAVPLPHSFRRTVAAPTTPLLQAREGEGLRSNSLRPSWESHSPYHPATATQSLPLRSKGEGCCASEGVRESEGPLGREGEGGANKDPKKLAYF